MTKPKSNPDLARLLELRLKQERLTKKTLREKVEHLMGAKFSRSPIEGLVRGETARLDPQVTNEVARVLKVDVTDILEAAGFRLALSLKDELPDELAEVWPTLSPKSRATVVDIALGLRDH